MESIDKRLPRQEEILQSIKNRLKQENQLREDGRGPRNEDWWHLMEKSVLLLESGEMIGHVGNEIIIADPDRSEGNVPRVDRENTLASDGTVGGSVWALRDAFLVGEHGINTTLLSEPPAGCVVPDESSGDVAYFLEEMS